MLNNDCGILVGPTKVPETIGEDDDYEIDNGIGVGMQVHFRDVEIDPVVVMDRRQLLELIKYLKKAYKNSRKWTRSKQSF